MDAFLQKQRNECGYLVQSIFPAPPSVNELGTVMFNVPWEQTLN